MALPAQRWPPAPSPVRPGAGCGAALPRDPGRATELLYRRHGVMVFRYAWHLLGRREDAEDASQATFLAVHRALAGGTAVLEPGAWVIRIARNECMGRLRQVAQRPALDALDGDLEPPAAGGVERTAELHDEMRTARKALSGLPVPEREALVLREWLGFKSGEVALTMGLTAGDVDALAGRARRSLVLAVGGLEPAVGCAGTQAALEAGSLDRAGKVHLLRCPVCRGVRRALRPPDASTRSLAPVAQRLGAVLPGFASGGGGIAAALTAKATAAPLLAKTAALVAAALVTGGAVETIRSTQPAHHTAAPAARGAHAHALSSAPAPTTQRTAVAVSSPLVTLSRTTVAVEAPTRGGAAAPTVKHAASGNSDDRGSAAQRHDSSGAGNGQTAVNKAGGDDESGSLGDDHASRGQARSSDEGADAGGDRASGSGDTGASHDDHGNSDASASDDGSDGATTGVSGPDDGDDGALPTADDATAADQTDTSAD